MSVIVHELSLTEELQKPKLVMTNGMVIEEGWECFKNDTNLNEG